MYAILTTIAAILRLIANKHRFDPFEYDAKLERSLNELDLAIEDHFAN